MLFSIRIAGPAGKWINSTADLIALLFAQCGYKVLSDIEYESRIKGGVNWFDLYIDPSDQYLTNQIDILLTFSKESLLKSLPNLTWNAKVFLCEALFAWLDVDFFQANKSLVFYPIQAEGKFENIYLLTELVYYFGLPQEQFIEVLQKIFWKKSQEIFETNRGIFLEIIPKLTFPKREPCLPVLTSNYEMSYGNKLLAYGAIDSWLEYYSAYPMTPASSILTEIIASKKVPYLQAEDEIAVALSALGAGYSWKRAMVGTSGGGFALMVEGLSFSVMAEIPLTVVLSQRAGPSTGTPTFHEQWDLTFALYPTFWDFEHIVLAPSSLEEAYTFAWLALNLADTYQQFLILLIDKQLSELIGTHEILQSPEINRGKMNLTPSQDYLRYALTEDGISPRVPIGTPNGDFIASSYEHSESGETTEDTIMKKKMTEKRFLKFNDFFRTSGLEGFEIMHPTSTKFIVTFWATAYTARKFVSMNPNFGLIILKIMKPFDERLSSILNVAKELIFVECNYSGQLEKYVTDTCGLKYNKEITIKHLRKYDLFPFFLEDFESLLQ